MIELVEEQNEHYNTTPLAPALQEFADNIREVLAGIEQADLNEKLVIEAKIYGNLVQTLDKYGLRTYGLATAVKKYYSYFTVEVITTGDNPKIIKEIKIPFPKNSPR